MKKIVFAVGLLFMMKAAEAQRFHAGLSAGAVITDIPGTDLRDGDVDFHKWGLAAGGLVNTAIGPNNDFQFEINYIQKGSMQPPDTLNNGYFKFSLAYIEVPLLFKHRLHFTANKKQQNTFGFELGMSVGRAVSFSEIVNNYPQSFDKSMLNKTDISVLAGVNYFFSEHFYFGFRFSNSVVPALKRNSAPLFLYRYTFNNGNNVVMQLSFKYVFGRMTDKAAGGNNSPTPQ